MEDLKILLEKAKELEKRFEDCEADDSHIYSVEGFSVIAHPMVAFNIFPEQEPITYSSYVCSRCGNRVSVEEGRKYAAARNRRLTERKENAELRRRFESGEWTKE